MFQIVIQRIKFIQARLRQIQNNTRQYSHLLLTDEFQRTGHDAVSQNVPITRTYVKLIQLLLHRQFADVVGLFQSHDALANTNAPQMRTSASSARRLACVAGRPTSFETRIIAQFWNRTHEQVFLNPYALSLTVNLRWQVQCDAVVLAFVFGFAWQQVLCQ